MKKQLKVLALMLGVAGLATSAAHAQDKLEKMPRSSGQ